MPIQFTAHHMIQKEQNNECRILSWPQLCPDEHLDKRKSLLIVLLLVDCRHETFIMCVYAFFNSHSLLPPIVAEAFRGLKNPWHLLQNVAAAFAEISDMGQLSSSNINFPFATKKLHYTYNFSII